MSLDTAFGGVDLQSRDAEVFRMIHEQGFMTLNQIRTCFWPDASRDGKSCDRRIMKLREYGFLAEAETSDRSLKSLILTRKAADELKRRKLDSGLGFYEVPSYFENNYQHSLHVNNLRTVFREIGFEDWESERHLREVKKLQFVPDGVINYLGFRFAVEFEMTQKEKERYERRFEYFRKNPDYKLVFMVVHNPGMMQLMSLNYDTAQVWFIPYWELMEQKREVVFKNITGNFRLARILK